MRQTILIIGASGGTGKALTRALLQYENVNLIIAGRTEQKLKTLHQQYQQDFLGSSVKVCVLDATDKTSLINAFEKADVAIMTATIPDFIHVIAEAAISTQTEVIDILVRGDVVDKLKPYQEAFEAADIRYITQSGFHPGMITPFIKLARDEFDIFKKARVAMAMDEVFESADSVNEILYEVAHSSSLILKEGQWLKATYKDCISVPFEIFGNKMCYPLQMREMYGLEDELGLEEAGTYAAGFNKYIDYFLFPMAMLLGKISDRLNEKITSRLLYREAQRRKGGKSRVEMVMQAEGLKNGSPKSVQYALSHADGYELTALAIIALLRQMWHQEISKTGLHLMGQVVNERQLFEDLRSLDVVVDGYIYEKSAA